jgi:hypothetical protein
METKMENEGITNRLSAEEITNPIIRGDNSLLTSLFKNPRTAERIYDDLLAQGYKQDDITLVMSEDTRNDYFPDNTTATASDLGNKTLEGLGVGAAIGGSVGALAAAIAAMGTSLVIPGLGLIVAGSLAASFAGAGAGAAAGGLIGALVGSETPSDQVKLLEEGLKKGGVVIAIKARSDEDRERLHEEWLDLQKKDTFTQAA